MVKHSYKVKEYRSWHAMVNRCYGNTDRSIHYRDRGIRVCSRWRHSFDNFVVDLGFAPTERHSLDRIDNDGDYTPANCRWATASQQARNKQPVKISRSQVQDILRLAKLGFGISDLGRKFSVSHSLVSMTVSGKRHPRGS